MLRNTLQAALGCIRDRLPIAGVLLGALSGAAHAAPGDVYFCKFNTSNYHNVPIEAVVVGPDGPGKFFVYDGLIIEMFGENNYQPARLLRNDAKIALYTWTLSGMKSSDGFYIGTMDFRLSIQKSTKQANFFAKSRTHQGYDWRSSGACTLEK